MNQLELLSRDFLMTTFSKVLTVNSKGIYDSKIYLRYLLFDDIKRYGIYSSKVITFGLYNVFGSLGRDTDQISPQIPGYVEGIPRPMKTFSGLVHNLILTEDGNVYGFGNNEDCELGIESIDSSIETPESLNVENIVNLDTFNQSFLIDKDNNIINFGKNDIGQLVMPENKTYCLPSLNHKLIEMNIIKISAGANFNLFMNDKHEIYGIGVNGIGQINDSGINISELTRLHFEDLEDDEYISDMKAGVEASLFLTNKGNVYFRGFIGVDERILNGDNIDDLYPNLRGFIGNDYEIIYMKKNYKINMGNIVKIFLLGFIKVLLDDKGNVYTFGVNLEGIVIDGFNIEYDVIVSKLDGISNVDEIASTMSHIFMLKNEKLYIAGTAHKNTITGNSHTYNIVENYYHEINSWLYLKPTLVPGITGIKSISTGEEHVVLICNEREK